MLLEVNDLVKKYKKGPLANDHISLSVGQGEIFGLLGPNGAGKTTLVNQIIGLKEPTSGEIKLNGVNIIDNPDYARENCSFQAQTQVPIAGLTAMQAIELTGRIRGGSKQAVRKKANELIDSLEIGEWANKMGATFSGGVRRIVAFCMACVVPGQIVILDEPTNDVDPIRRRLLWKEVQTIAEAGSTVLLVTHNVLEAERAVDRLAIIDNGKIIGMGTPAELKGQQRGIMRLEMVMEPGQSAGTVPDYMTHIISSNRRFIATVSDTEVVDAIGWAKSLKDQGIAEEYLIGPTTLEDAYVRLVGRFDILESPDSVE